MSFILTAVGVGWLIQNWQIVALVLGIMIAIIWAYRSSKKADAKERNRVELESIRKRELQEKEQVKAAQEKKASFDNWQQNQEQKEAITSAAQRRAEEEKRIIAFPPDFNGIPSAYHYEKVHIQLSDDFRLESYVGNPVSFQLSDGKAAVILSGAMIGFIASGRIASMVTDWISRNHPILACLTSADDEKREYGVDIVFYRDQYKYLLERHPDAKKYRITGNKSEEMQDRVSDLKEGKPLTIEYDSEKDKYAVCDGWEIGYLPASAARIVEERGADDVTAYVAGTEIDDNWKTVVYIYLFE